MLVGSTRNSVHPHPNQTPETDKAERQDKAGLRSLPPQRTKTENRTSAGEEDHVLRATTVTGHGEVRVPASSLHETSTVAAHELTARDTVDKETVHRTDPPTLTGQQRFRFVDV